MHEPLLRMRTMDVVAEVRKKRNLCFFFSQENASCMFPALGSGRVYRTPTN